MKKLVLLSALILLSGCTIGGNKSKTVKKFDTTPKVVSERITTTSIVGEICGGSEKMKCHQDLSCIFDYDTADGHGICAEKVKKEQDCEEVYKPVCGLNDGQQKYTYFNECQAERHGAEILAEGKCEIDKEVAGNCEAKARGFSNCFDTTIGYEFDGKNCAKKVVASCNNSAEIPFETMESCESSCK